MNAVDTNRLKQITALYRFHETEEDIGTMTVMQAVAWVAHEELSDQPECACPFISKLVDDWSDALPSDDRMTLLLSLIPKLVGSRGSDKLAERRSLMAGDWLIRINAPAWLRLAGMTVHADVLAGLPEIVSRDQFPSIRGPIEAAQRDAVAAWNAIQSDVNKAARSAAEFGALNNLEAAGHGFIAWQAVQGAALAAARVAACSAAKIAASGDEWNAVDNKLMATKTALQQSAIALIERMIAANEIEDGQIVGGAS